MNARYKLSWEEFVETSEAAWPKPDVFAFVVILAAAVPMAAYGIALLLHGPSEPIMLYLFVGFPVFLVAMAIESFTFETKAARKTAIAVAHSQYERFHAAEQVFAFDHEKWAHETEAGKQETPWLALRHATEWQHVFSLAGDKNSALIPKRALEPSALENLRQVALGLPATSITFRIQCAHYMAVGTSLLWRRYWFLLGFGNIFGLAMLLWIANTVAGSQVPFAPWGWLPAGCAVVLVLSAQLWYFPLRYLTTEGHGHPFEAAFSDRGVRIKTSKTDSFSAWSTFTRFREMKSAFLLYRETSRYALLGKQCLLPEQCALLRQMLQAKLKQEPAQASEKALA